MSDTSPPTPGALATILGLLKSGASSVGGAFTGMAQHGLQAQQNFMDGIDPNTGQPAVTPYGRANTLAHFFTGNMGPQSVAGLAAGRIGNALGAGPVLPSVTAAGRPLEYNTLGALSRADKLPDAPYLTFDASKSGGYEGVFPTEDSAQAWVTANSKNGKIYDYGTPRSIEQFNPTGDQSPEFQTQRLQMALTQAQKANDNRIPLSSLTPNAPVQ